MSSPSTTGRINAILDIGGVVFTFLLLEVGLQSAAFVAGQPPDVWQQAGAIRLLALGDSSTYAWGLEESEAYPMVLERLWNADATRPRLEVLNLGVPGTNSSQLRKHLPQLLNMLRPDVVTVMVGVNDFWTVAEPVGETDLRRRIDSALWRYSRLYRMVLMLRRGCPATPIDIPRTASRAGDGVLVQVGDERVAWRLEMRVPGQPKPAQAPLEENLAALVRQAEAAGVELVFLTYPNDVPTAHYYHKTNRLIRRAAAESGARLIDLVPISGACSEVPCNTLRENNHPNVLGHALAGEIIAEALTEPLGATRGPNE